jgi:pimeloyl-ACP methyl ester carboxylesterase
MRITTGDCELELDVRGATGPAIVLVHGLGGTCKAWGPLMPLLSARARVFAPDLRGCGKSTRGTAEWSLAQAADDVEAAARAVGLDRYALVGHSLGGVIVEEILVRRPEAVSAAVLIATSSRLNEQATENWRRLAASVEKRGIPSSPAAAERSPRADRRRRSQPADRDARARRRADPRLRHLKDRGLTPS